MIKYIRSSILAVFMGAGGNLPAEPLPVMPNSGDLVAYWRGKFEKAEAETVEHQKLDQLGEVIRGVGHFKQFGNRYSLGQLPELLTEVQSAMISIPGHADYIAKSIKDLQTKLNNAPEADKWNVRPAYDSAQASGFETLSHLPSAETVRVLGEFLYDEEGGINMKEGASMPTLDESMAQQKKNCNKAVITLSVLIDSPPVEKSGSLRAEVFEAWRRWHEQVKAGQRTFRFVGDPTEYDLNGRAPKEKLNRIARARKRDSEREAGHKKIAGSSDLAEPVISLAPSKTTPVSILIAGMLLLGSLVWYLMKARGR